MGISTIAEWLAPFAVFIAFAVWWSDSVVRRWAAVSTVIVLLMLAHRWDTFVADHGVSCYSERNGPLACG